MILHSLTLENVGPYAGAQTLDFGTDRRRPVTLIGGLNGAGKTTLIQSLFHVLYGARSLSELGTRRSYRSFLTDRIHRGADSASIELALTIPGLRGDAPISVRRQWRAHASTASDSLDVFVDGSYDEALSESWEQTIEQIAPLAVARLFFFDGEKIEALADLDAAASSLRTAVGSLLGLDLVDQLQTDLVAVQRRALRAADSASSTKIASHDRELSGAEELLRTITARVAELESELVGAQEDHQHLHDALSAAGGELVPERASLESQAQEAQATETLAWEQLRKLAIDPAGPLALVPDLLEQLTLTARRHQHGSDAQRMLSLLAERDQWIVAELKRLGIGPTAKLARTLSDDRKRRAGEDQETAAFAPTQAPAAISEVASERVTEWRAEALQMVDRLDEAVALSDELDRRISRIPSPDSVRVLIDAVQDSQQRLDALEHELAEQKRLLGAAETQLSRARSRREGEISRAAEREDEDERRQRVVRHAELAKQTLGRLHARVARRHVGRIAQYTMQCLEQLLRKERLIGAVDIDPESFALTLWGVDGATLRSDGLSAGERQLTALALLWALAGAAGRPLPVVIDTPLGRLDASHRRHVVERYIPAASHQVVVLSTDTEIDGEMYELISPRIGAERHLQSDSYGRTTIHDGYLHLVTA